METEKEKILEGGEARERDFERFDPDAPIFGYFELTQEVTGEFFNRVEFQIKNIAMGGFNLLSNYPPLIGNTYPIYINYKDGKHEFSVKIVHSRILRFQGQPEGIFNTGMVYSIGCQILFQNDFQKSLVLGIIQNDCGIPLLAVSAS